MMQPARDQDAQIQQVLDRLGLTPQQVLHHHHTFGDRLSASTGRLGARIPERVLPPVRTGCAGGSIRRRSTTTSRPRSIRWESVFATSSTGAAGCSPITAAARRG